MARADDDVSSGQVSALTDAGGLATFRILGGSTSSGAITGGLCCHMTVDGVDFGNYTVASYDLSGLLGYDGLDLGLYSSDYFNRKGPSPAPFAGRSDFDFSGEIAGTDLSIWGLPTWVVLAAARPARPIRAALDRGFLEPLLACFECRNRIERW